MFHGLFTASSSLRKNRTCKVVPGASPLTQTRPSLRTFSVGFEESEGQISNLSLLPSTLFVLPTWQAIKLMRDQSSRGHVFNMDGAGADGNPTPR